jgi:DNA-binding SARP family transcriptional activator/TolB-like protein
VTRSRETFHLRTLGRLALTDSAGREDPSLSTRPRKLAVLAWLALRPERRATRDRLIGVFWGDRDEDRARNSLSDAISHLRRVLGRDAICTPASEVVVADDASLRIDALDLTAAAARGDHGKVVDLYHGPFLDGFYIADAPEFDEWRDRERSRLERLFVKSAAACCAELAATGSWESCRAIAERWLAVEPASGDAALMVLRATGAPATHAAYAAVLSAYESLVQRLDRELGIAPDAGVTAFAKEVAQRLSSVPAPVHVSLARAPDAMAPTTATNRRDQRSWRRLASIAAAFVAVGAIAAAFYKQPELDRHRVIVAAFQNETGDTALSRLGAVAADWVSRGLAETHAVEVADPLLSMARDTPVDPRVLGRGARAGIVVVGSYARQGDSIAIDARLVDANTGRVLRATKTVTAPVSEPLVAVNEMRQRVTGALAAEVDPVITRLAREASQPPTYDAYLAWVEGLDLFSRKDFNASVRPFLQAAALDSSFVSPRIWAIAAYGNVGDFHHADSIFQAVWPMRTRLAPLDRGLLGVWSGVIHGDRMEEYAASREMLAAAPGSELSLFIGGVAARAVNRPNEAAALIRRIPVENSSVLWDVYGTGLAEALHMAGRPDEELREATRRLSRQPSSMRAMVDQARALVVAGRAHEAAEMASRILERGRDPSRPPASAAREIADELAVHGHAAAALGVYRAVAAWGRALPTDQATRRLVRLSLAAALYYSGELVAADSLVRVVLDSAPNDVSFLGWHGVIAARRGDRLEAARTSERLANLTTPYLHGANTLARSEIAALLGNVAEASRLARQAIAEGVTPFTLHLRPNLVPLLGDPAFKALVTPIG